MQANTHTYGRELVDPPICTAEIASLLFLLEDAYRWNRTILMIEHIFISLEK